MDDFVVDDDGRGYAGNVSDESDHGSESEEDDASPSGKRGRGSSSAAGGKRKKGASPTKAAAPASNKRITELFQSATAAKGQSSSAAPAAQSAQSAAGVSDDALQAMLADLVQNPGAAAPIAQTASPFGSGTAPRKGKKALSAQALYGSSTSSPSPSRTPAETPTSAQPPAKVAEASPFTSPAATTTSMAPPSPSPAAKTAMAPLAPSPAAAAPPTPTFAAAKKRAFDQVNEDNIVSIPVASVSAAAAAAQPLALEGNLLRFYWLDAHEANGHLYMFGKVHNSANGKFESCCVTIKNIERNLFVLPREHQLDGTTIIVHFCR